MIGDGDSGATIARWLQVSWKPDFKRDWRARVARDAGGGADRFRNRSFRRGHGADRKKSARFAPAGHQIALTTVWHHVFHDAFRDSARRLRCAWGHAIGLARLRRSGAGRMDGHRIGGDGDVLLGDRAAGFSSPIARWFTPETEVIGGGSGFIEDCGGFSIIRRIARGSDRGTARTGRHAHTDALSFHGLLGDRTAGGLAIVFPVRPGRGGIMDGVVSWVDRDRARVGRDVEKKKPLTSGQWPDFTWDSWIAIAFHCPLPDWPFPTGNIRKVPIDPPWGDRQCQ